MHVNNSLKIACNLVKGLKFSFVKRRGNPGREVRTESFKNPMLPESQRERYVIELKKAQAVFA